MYRKLFLGLLVASFLAGDVTAQSGARSSGSSSRGYSARNSRNSKIQKANFAGIKLDSSQKKALSELVGSNFDDLTKLDTQMVALVPEDKVKSLRNGYTSSKKKGNSDADAMMMSMKSIGLSEQLQSQVMDLRNEQEAVYQEIASEVAGLFDEEQKKMLMAKMEEKEQMMAKEMTEKEEMAEKEMHGIGGERFDRLRHGQPSWHDLSRLQAFGRTRFECDSRFQEPQSRSWFTDCHI